MNDMSGSTCVKVVLLVFFFQAEDGIRDYKVTGVQTCALPIWNACVWLRADCELDTGRFTEYLTAQNMTSNVELEQVESVDWKDLKGFDDVIQALEAKIALPLESRALAAELQLRPKRGVLLAGPPGTGKTTIGRALAGRLKSKFFLIDGTVIAGTCYFYDRVKEIFEAAKRNAPSVVFIDDGDLIFENSEGRYSTATC